MKRRLTRAKTKIKATGIPFAVPDPHRLPDRVDAVLAVIYLIYNEGYRGRIDLGAEAIRLGQVLTALMPDKPEAHGLLALMLIHHARRRARFSGDDLVLLDDQDRTLWDMREIATGRAVLDRAIALGGRGPYVIQAMIASLQTAERIDWPQIAGLYRRLVDLTGSPVVELNRAVAIAQAGDPAAALRTVDGLDLPGYLYFHSTRGELLRRLGRDEEARAAYRRALDLAISAPERRFLSHASNCAAVPDAGAPSSSGYEQRFQSGCRRVSWLRTRHVEGRPGTHPEIAFSVRQLLVTRVSGRFTRYDITIVTGEDPLDSSVNATIDLASLDTGNEKRDQHIRTETFFDVANHPSASDRSTGIRRSDEGWAIDGDLTLHGITRNVPLAVTVTGFSSGPHGDQQVGISATAHVSRGEFDIDRWTGGGLVVSDKVPITFRIQAIQVIGDDRRKFTSTQGVIPCQQHR